MSNSDNIFVDWEESSGNLNQIFKSLNFFEDNSVFKDSPFGENWEKDLPEWALAFYGSSKVISKPNLKFIDKTQTITQSNAEGYVKIAKEQINPYEYKIFYHESGDGEEVLKTYSDPKIIPAKNQVFVFIEIDDDKFDFGKIVRVKLGADVIRDMKFKFTESYLSDEELATEIIRKVNLLKSDNVIVNDIKNSRDFNKLLLRAIDYEYNNKKFDEFSFLILLTGGLEFIEFKSIDWLQDISNWLRERKYEDEKYWNGHLDKEYEPAFLPTSLFNKTKQEKEELIHKMINEPLTLIDRLLEEKFGKENALSSFIKPKLQGFKQLINQKLKPYGLQMIEAIDVVESVETMLQYYNAIWVGIWNGIVEFIAGLIDLVEIILIIIKREVGFRITDTLWEKIEKLFNFVYYETQNFLDLVLDKAITFAYEVYYLDFNGYKVAKEIGELIPDIIAFAISWLKAAKLAKAGSVATIEEIAAKEALERIEKESVEEVGEKAVKEAERKLNNLIDIDEIGLLSKTTKAFLGLKYDVLIYSDRVVWKVYDNKFIWDNYSRLWNGELYFDYNTFGIKGLAQEWTTETFEIFKGRIKSIKAEWTTNPFYPNGEALGYKQFWNSYLETGDEYEAVKQTTFYKTMKGKGFSKIDKVYIHESKITVILKP